MLKCSDVIISLGLCAVHTGSAAYLEVNVGEYMHCDDFF